MLGKLFAQEMRALVKPAAIMLAIMVVAGVVGIGCPRRREPRGGIRLPLCQRGVGRFQPDRGARDGGAVLRLSRVGQPRGGLRVHRHALLSHDVHRRGLSHAHAAGAHGRAGDGEILRRLPAGGGVYACGLRARLIGRARDLRRRWGHGVGGAVAFGRLVGADGQRWCGLVGHRRGERARVRRLHRGAGVPLADAGRMVGAAA